MIEVKRSDHPAKTLRNGEIRPAFYECHYYHNGKQIAWYDSKQDVIYLRTDFIGTNFKETPYTRALKCPMSDAYKYLFEMLNVDEKTKISEFTAI